MVSQTAADFDRNGTQDIFATENTYAGSTQVMWTYDGSTYNASQLAMGTTIWYGGVIAYDKTGDGYLDTAYGDSGADSITYLINKNGYSRLTAPTAARGSGDSSPPCVKSPASILTMTAPWMWFSTPTAAARTR